jgi:hypothetical protein
VENVAIKMAVQQGIWAVLFLMLLFYIFKKQEQRDKKCEDREGKYQEIINKLTDKFSILEDVKKDIEEVKNKIFK